MSCGNELIVVLSIIALPLGFCAMLLYAGRQCDKHDIEMMKLQQGKTYPETVQ